MQPSLRCASASPFSAFFRVSLSDSAKATETKRADAQRMRVKNLMPDFFARWRLNVKKLATGVGRVKESFPRKVVSGLLDPGPKIAAGFLKNCPFQNVEKFALRVVGNLWRLLAFS